MKEKEIMSFESKLMWISKSKISLSFVCGYMTAVIIAPCEIPVKKWADRLLRLVNYRGSQNIYKNMEFIHEFKNFYNLLVDSIKKKNYNSFTKRNGNNDLKKAKDWSDGFLYTMGFWDNFKEMLDDRKVHECLSNILYLSNPDKMMEAYRVDKADKKKVEEISADNLNKIVPVMRKLFIRKKLLSKDFGYMSIENKNEMVCA